MKFIEWINQSTSGVEAFGGAEPSLRDRNSLRQAVDCWRHHVRVASRDAIREVKRKDVAEAAAIAGGEFGTMSVLRPNILGRCLPLLRNFVESGAAALTDNTRHQFVSLMMVCLMIERPCRPGTYYSA